MDKNQFGAHIKLEPWFYQVDTLVPTMDLSADRIWDQSLLTVRINTRTWVAPSEVASSKTGNKAGPDPT